MKRLEWNDDQAFTMDQAAQIVGVQRSTATGYVHRYPALRIESVTPGATRRLSLNQVTALCLVRQLIRAKLEARTIASALDKLRGHAWETFEQVQDKAIDGEFPWMRNGVEQPPKRRLGYMFEATYFATFISMSFTGEEPDTVVINDRPGDTANWIRDLQGYALPTVLIPLDQVLSNCWARALTLANDIALDD
jgi:hypothetical protein